MAGVGNLSWLHAVPERGRLNASKVPAWTQLLTASGVDLQPFATVQNGGRFEVVFLVTWFVIDSNLERQTSSPQPCATHFGRNVDKV